MGCPGSRRDRSQESHTCDAGRSEEHTSELESQSNLVCRLLLEKKTSQHFVVLSTEPVQTQREPQLLAENAHHDRSLHWVRHPPYPARFLRYALLPTIEAELVTL